MYVLTLQSELPPSPAMRPLWRRIAAIPAPAVIGLLARHWQMDRRGFIGCYLFEDLESADAFARELTASDPAVYLLQHGLTLSPKLERIDKPLEDGFFDRPVFILSSPRSGSTLLYELLSNASKLWTIDGESHGIIEGIPGLHPAHREFESHRLTTMDVGPDITRALCAGFTADLRNHLRSRYLDLPVEARPEHVRLLEKTPENALRIPFLNAIFPDARFIFLHRDARQTISSLVEAWRHGGFINILDLPGWNRRHWCFLLPSGWQSLNGAALSDIVAFQWRAANTQILDDLAAVPRERWTVVEYADLVAAPKAVAQRLCQFMEVDFDPGLESKLSHPLSLSSTTISPPSPIKWRSNPDFHESSLTSLGPIMGRLRDLTDHAVPPPARHMEQGTNIRFSCFIDEIPITPATSESIRSGDLIVNPSLDFQLGQTIPLPLLRRTRFRDRFLMDHPLLWIEDERTGVLYAYWAKRNQVQLYLGFKAGRKPPESIAPELIAQLRAAGILVTAAEIANRQSEGKKMIEKAGKEMAEERFCKLSSLLHPMQIGALARYYRALLNAGKWKLGDGQVERRYGWHNEPIARYFHFQLTDFVSRIAGEPVKPTYAYSSAYRGGAALRAHLDRRQCEFTISLLIDQTTDAEPWPLWFQTAAGRTSVILACGDAVLFRGSELPHWREAAPMGQYATMLLFHYVPSGFIGVLD